MKLKDGRGKAHSKYSEDDLLALHRAGLTQTAAAEVLGVHITSVHKKAKRMGLRWGRK